MQHLIVSNGNYFYLLLLLYYYDVNYDIYTISFKKFNNVYNKNKILIITQVKFRLYAAKQCLSLL